MVRTIDLNTFPRADHFRYFAAMPNPYVGVTVDADVTELVQFSKANGISFYLLFMHLAALAADQVPQFRQRIREGGIVEYDECPTSHIEMLDDETYCYCTLRHHMPLEEYLRVAEERRRMARERASIQEDADSEFMVFITSLPWLRYTALIQPTGGDSNPRISWGRYAPDFQGRLMMPVTVLAHHALVDGLHISRFYQNLNDRLREGL